MAIQFENRILTNTAVNGVIWGVGRGDSLYVTKSGELYATGSGGTAIVGASTATVTIAGQVFGDYAIRMEENSVTGYGGSTVSVLDGGIVTGDITGVEMQGTNNTVTIAGQVSGDYGIFTGQNGGLGASTVTVVAGGVVTGDIYGVG